jgi:hypothetical protein
MAAEVVSCSTPHRNRMGKHQYMVFVTLGLIVETVALAGPMNSRFVTTGKLGRIGERSIHRSGVSLRTENPIASSHQHRARKCQEHHQPSQLSPERFFSGPLALLLGCQGATQTIRTQLLRRASRPASRPIDIRHGTHCVSVSIPRHHKRHHRALHRLQRVTPHRTPQRVTRRWVQHFLQFQRPRALETRMLACEAVRDGAITSARRPQVTAPLGRKTCGAAVPRRVAQER